MATYAIGDVQGCYQSLQKLLNKISFNPAKDQIWLVGDLINRGPKSLKTLEYLYEIRSAVKIVLGNHDLHFLAVESGLHKLKNKDTLKKILKSSNRQKLVDWLSKQPLVYYDAKLNFAMCHAGIPIQWNIQQAIEYSQEVSQFLQSPERNQFFKVMYGNKPANWSQQLSQLDRLRYITNGFTRMRFCYLDGSLELTCKLPPGEQTEQLRPWFELPRKPLGCQLVFGHWASLQGLCTHPDMYALDTGCVWGGKLTALRLEDKTLFQVKSVEKK